MNTDEFRRTGHELIEWIAAYRDRMESLPVMSPVQPGDIARQLPCEPPLQGEGLEHILQDLDSGQIGRPQDEHETPVSRDGWR